MKNQRSKFVSLAILVALLMISLNLFTNAPSAAAQSTLYTSCAADKLTAPLTLQDAAGATMAATSSATMMATSSATMAATAMSTAAASAGTDTIMFLSIVGSESEACYLATENFLSNNPMGLKAGFNNPVGITKTIGGDIALDLSNTANSQIGDLKINISEFKSDDDRRDGFIRKRFLELNTYPFATLTNATAIGLPTGAYTEGTTLQFKIKGTLTVHNTKRDTTFDATGSYKSGTLVVRAVTDLKISDFGIQVPAIGGILKVDDPMRLVINIVARQQVATPAPTK